MNIYGQKLEGTTAMLMFPCNMQLKQYSWGIPWALLKHQNVKVSLSVTDLACCILSIILQLHRGSDINILFVHDFQLTVFKVTLNKHNQFTRIDGICSRDISVSPCFTALTHVVQGQQDLFLIMFLKMIHPRVLRWIYSPFGMKLHVVCQAKGEYYALIITQCTESLTISKEC